MLSSLLILFAPIIWPSNFSTIFLTTIFLGNQCLAPNERIIAVETEILPPDLPTDHWGPVPITADLNTCQKPSWSLTYALIFYWPFRSVQCKTLIRRHVTASGATAGRAAHSFSLIMPFFYFCIRYCVVSVLECLLCLNHRSPGWYRWRSAWLALAFTFPWGCRAWCLQVAVWHTLRLILCWNGDAYCLAAVWLCF